VSHSYIAPSPAETAALRVGRRTYSSAYTFLIFHFPSKRIPNQWAQSQSTVLHAPCLELQPQHVRIPQIPIAIPLAIPTCLAEPTTGGALPVASLVGVVKIELLNNFCHTNLLLLFISVFGAPVPGTAPFFWGTWPPRASSFSWSPQLISIIMHNSTYLLDWCLLCH